MPNDVYSHTPVLLKEVIELTNPQPGQNFVDATLGGAGYSQAILNRIASGGKLLSIDLDLDAVERARKQKSNQKLNSWTIAHGNFAHIDKIIKAHDFPAPDGIVADLGLSSYELDQSSRGMSFASKEVLDMRFDQAEVREDARFFLNNYDERQLTKIFRDFGEEKFSRQVAKKIAALRAKGEVIKYTTDLYQAIQDALPKPVKHKAADSARRIFQALRIAVNNELQNLEEFLPKAFDILAPGGRLAVVSFHSLEDRMVKRFFAALTKGCVCPPEFPICQCGRNPQGKLLRKKPVTASPEELARNSRAKPAKLRAIRKL